MQLRSRAPIYIASSASVGEALRRLGDIALPLRRPQMKIAPLRSYPWLLIVLGAAAWFALWALYS